MPRSERCRIRGNCLHGIAPLSLAQAPVAGAAPAADRAAPAWGGRSGRSEPPNGVEPFRRPLGGSARAAIRCPGGCEGGSCQKPLSASQSWRRRKEREVEAAVELALAEAA